MKARIEKLAAEKRERGLFNELSKIAFADIRKIVRQKAAASGLGLRSYVLIYDLGISHELERCPPAARLCAEFRLAGPAAHR